jgi:hypothetical protein
MDKILYYSLRDKNSIELINKISKIPDVEKIHFVSLDNIISKNNRKYAILSNGYETLIPSKLISVPSLILCNRGNMIIEGFEPIYNELIQKTNNRRHPKEEPNSFNMNQFGGVTSSLYSSINNYGQMLSTQDNNNDSCDNFQKYGDNFVIETQAETYVSNKIKDTVGSYNANQFDKPQINQQTQMNQQSQPQMNQQNQFNMNTNKGDNKSFEKMQEDINRMMEQQSTKHSNMNTASYDPSI